MNFYYEDEECMQPCCMCKKQPRQWDDKYCAECSNEVADYKYEKWKEERHG